VIHKALISPRSIAVIGASENTAKPGGKVVINLLEGGFKGNIYAVNHKKAIIPGTIHIYGVHQLPEVDLAILAIPADQCIHQIEKLCEKGTRAFIVFSAGFGEAGPLGRERENKLRTILERYNANLLGPNCIGVINEFYKGVFTSPVPEFHPTGCELISSSGATAVFILEAAHNTGLKFSNIYSIGNAAHTGAEELLEYMDLEYEHGKSPGIKLLYLEDIRNPAKFLKHARSLACKGCRIAAIKSGYSEAGSRAASSHTGALATSDLLIRALFRKAGIVYCQGREDLISVACVWQTKPLKGNRLAIITHAGGSAVMITDMLTSRGMMVPPIDEEKGRHLLPHLHPGSAVNNPIDFLATGTADQLGRIIDFCEALENIDGMVVVFGSPGLFNVEDAYNVLHQKMLRCSKPIYPVLPSVVNAGQETMDFIARGHVHFPYEVSLGKALAMSHIDNRNACTETESIALNHAAIRAIIYESPDGWMSPDNSFRLLEAAGLKAASFVVCKSADALPAATENLKFPLAAKWHSTGHKSDFGGVHLNISTQSELVIAFNQIMEIPDCDAILIQEMHRGEELYCGAKKYPGYGHLILCGPGGIYVEILGDIAFGLAPVSETEARQMIRSLKTYPIIRGFRHKQGVNEDAYVEAIVRIAALTGIAPEIAELDINPFIANRDSVTVVDVRIRVER